MIYTCTTAGRGIPTPLSKYAKNVEIFSLKEVESEVSEKNKMDPEKNVVASLALHAVLEPVFKEVSH